MKYAYYSLIGIIAICIHLIINHELLLKNKKNSSGTYRIYRYYMNSVLAYYVTDTLWGFINLYGNMKLLYIDTIFYFVTMTVSIIIWCLYITDYLKLKNFMGRFLNLFGVFFCGVEIILLIINHFYHIFFWCYDDMGYQSYYFRDVVLIVQIVLFGIIALQTLIVAIKTGANARRNITICMFSIAMFIAISLQTLLPLLPIYTTGLMIGTCLLYVYIVDDEKEEFRKKAHAANKAKTAFLINMSHDIRTPMNAIVGFSNLLEKYAGDEEKCASYRKKLKDSSQFLQSLINNVLEVAKIESGNIMVNENIVNLNALFAEFKYIFEEQMTQKNIDFSITFEVEHNTVICDEVKVREIFLNLISNSYKYTLSGGKVEVIVKEAPCEKDGYMLLNSIVRDTGVGISKEFIPKIYDEFSREKTYTDNKIEGTGLGMSIVKNFVEVMKGDISIESEMGKGTSFEISVMFKIAEGGSVIVNDNNGSLYNIMGKKILLVEDNDFNAEIAIELLTDVGMKVNLAQDGMECVDMINASIEGEYELILMDIQMPNMNGYEATHIIREMKEDYKKNIPIIAMTANAFEEDKRKSLEAGMNGHITKPIDTTTLISTLSQIMNADK